MLIPSQIQSYLKAAPFRPFCLRMASGATFEIRHPEMAKLGRCFVLLFSFAPEVQSLIEKWETVSLMLIESVSHRDSAMNT